MSLKKINLIIEELKSKGFINEVTKEELEKAIMQIGGIHWQTRKNYFQVMTKLGYIKPKVIENGEVKVYELKISAVG